MTGYVYDDGGRSAAGYRGRAGDCVVRAIAIATGQNYRTVYDDLAVRIKAASDADWEKISQRIPSWRGKRNPDRDTSPRNGVAREVYEPYLLNEVGWQWTPVMRIGSGVTMHLRADELPQGRLIARLSKHLCAVIDGVVHDTYDPSRRGTRCVYGYYSPKAAD